eukprot:1160366-Pelagomonas_calceolata.AAC.4
MSVLAGKAELGTLEISLSRAAQALEGKGRVRWMPGSQAGQSGFGGQGVVVADAWQTEFVTGCFPFTDLVSLGCLPACWRDDSQGKLQAHVATKTGDVWPATQENGMLGGGAKRAGDACKQTPAAAVPAKRGHQCTTRIMSSSSSSSMKSATAPPEPSTAPAASNGHHHRQQKQQQQHITASARPPPSTAAATAPAATGVEKGGLASWWCRLVLGLTELQLGLSRGME